MFAAAVAMTMPTVEVAIFSTGRRASSTAPLRARTFARVCPWTHALLPFVAFLSCTGKLLEQIAELVLNNNSAEMAECIGKNNQESFWIKHVTENGSTSMAKINSYPSCAKTLRG